MDTSSKQSPHPPPPPPPPPPPSSPHPPPPSYTPPPLVPRDLGGRGVGSDVNMILIKLLRFIVMGKSELGSSYQSLSER